jgi:hypothetical protein
MLIEGDERLAQIIPLDEALHHPFAGDDDGAHSPRRRPIGSSPVELVEAPAEKVGMRERASSAADRSNGGHVKHGRKREKMGECRSRERGIWILRPDRCP